jgi:hypothetical protein
VCNVYANRSLIAYPFIICTYLVPFVAMLRLYNVLATTTCTRLHLWLAGAVLVVLVTWCVLCLLTLTQHSTLSLLRPWTWLLPRLRLLSRKPRAELTMRSKACCALTCFRSHIFTPAQRIERMWLWLIGALSLSIHR